MTRVSRPFDRVLKLLDKEITDPTPNQEVISGLLEIGLRVLKRAAESKETENHTLNQMEAFGCAVYFNGQRYGTKFLEDANYRGDHENKAGKIVKGAEADSKRGRMGRSMALHEIRDHAAVPQGYELYLTNAMWYSAIHESGWRMRNGVMHRPLRIITQELTSAIAEIEQRFGVTVTFEVWYNRVKK